MPLPTLLTKHFILCLQNQQPSPSQSPYLCRQRNARNGNDIETGSLLDTLGSQLTSSIEGSDQNIPVWQTYKDIYNNLKFYFADNKNNNRNFNVNDEHGDILYNDDHANVVVLSKFRKYHDNLNKNFIRESDSNLIKKYMS